AEARCIMSITLPTYSRLEIPLLGRRQRVWAIIATGLRKELRRPAAIVVMALGAAFTTITSIAILFIATIIPGGQAPNLTFFAGASSNFFVPLSLSFMVSVMLAGLTADVLQSMAFTVYLGLPITHLNYMVSQVAILDPC